MKNLQDYPEFKSVLCCYQLHLCNFCCSHHHCNSCNHFCYGSFIKVPSTDLNLTYVDFCEINVKDHFLLIVQAVNVIPELGFIFVF